MMPHRWVTLGPLRFPMRADELHTASVVDSARAPTCTRPLLLRLLGDGRQTARQDAQAVHQFLRQLVAAHNKNIAEKICILYGGSVKADNAASLFAMPDIDGALVGGASLVASDFLAICHAAKASIVG